MNTQQLLDQLLVLSRLKTMVRTGWVESKIINPESVADHSFNVALLAFLLAEDGKVNRNKVLKMALVHDLAEAITGDIVWKRGDKVDVGLKEEKDKMEKEVLNQLFIGIKENPLAENYAEAKDLVFEYMEQKSPEASFVKELDKLDMCIQALIYYKDFPFNEVWTFLKSASTYIISERGQQLFEEIKRRIIELEQ